MNSLSLIALCCIVVVFGGLPFSSNAQLDPAFYSKSCPQLQSIVQKVLGDVSRTDTRMPASIIRLHFHDCFVQVCLYTTIIYLLCFLSFITKFFWLPPSV
jgi:peroxidase